MKYILNPVKISLIVLVAILLVPIQVSAQSLQDQINTLNAQIKQNQEAANEKHSEATTLKETIADLNANIATAQKSLDVTNLEIAKNQAEIEKANKDLDKQKLILKDNLKIIYKMGDISPIEVVASSNNISDFVSQQEYLSAIKKKIDENLIKIDTLKKELETKKAELGSLSSKQKSQVNNIAEKRSQQSSLLAQTQGDEAKFVAVVGDLAAKRKKAEEAEKAIAAAAIASLKSGTLKSLGNVNAGDVIGYMGSTGNSTGTHLHFSVLNGGSFVNPNGSPFSYSKVTNGVVTQSYGPSSCSVCGYSFHNGIDIANPSNPPVKAAASGQIIFNGWDSYGFGHKVMILHDNGYFTLYGHLL